MGSPSWTSLVRERRRDLATDKEFGVHFVGPSALTLPMLDLEEKAAAVRALLREDTLIEGSFGTVTTRRVIYQRSKGWFSEGWRTHVSLAEVKSVTLKTTRNVLGGVACGLIGMCGLIAGVIPDLLSQATLDGAAVVSLSSIALAYLLLWGSPVVHIRTSEHKSGSVKGWPWQHEQAHQFVAALQGLLENNS